MFAELPIAVALSSPNLRFAYYAASSGKAYLLFSLSASSNANHWWPRNPPIYRLDRCEPLVPRML